MPRDKDETFQIAEDIAIIMSRGEMNLEKNNRFQRGFGQINWLTLRLSQMNAVNSAR